MKRTLTGLAVTWFLCFAAIPAVYAHKVTVFAWAEGDRVYTESKFSGGKKVKKGKVEVFDSSGRRLLVGRTDDNGAFTFKAPAIIDLKIVLTAGMGHRNSWLLSAAELGGEEPAPQETNASRAGLAALETHRDTVPASACPGLTAQEIEAIVSRQLEQKIKPLTRMVAASQEKGPTMNDVVGGIGYIIGLVGLGVYMRSRKGSRTP